MYDIYYTVDTPNTDAFGTAEKAVVFRKRPLRDSQYSLEKKYGTFKWPAFKGEGEGRY